MTTVVQILIGADFANKFLHDKKEVEGEVPWRTSFGWVLSGVVRPSENAASDAKLEAVNVHYVQNKIETLWEMEEPLQRADHPILPMTFQNGRYQVGLLWKGHERPDDNRSQALAVTRNRFVCPDEKGSMTTYRLTRLPFGVNCSPFIMTTR